MPSHSLRSSGGGPSNCSRPRLKSKGDCAFAVRTPRLLNNLTIKPFLQTTFYVMYFYLSFIFIFHSSSVLLVVLLMLLTRCLLLLHSLVSAAFLHCINILCLAFCFGASPVQDIKTSLRQQQIKCNIQPLGDKALGVMILVPWKQKRRKSHICRNGWVIKPVSSQQSFMSSHLFSPLIFVVH